MKKILIGILGTILTLSVSGIMPLTALAAGISPSGGGKYTTGQTFTVSVRASGTTFDSLQGTIAVKGPVSVVSFSAGSATWLPGKSPANNSQFVGITSATSSMTVATIKLRGTSPGSGSVSVSGVKLAYKGSVVGSDGGSTSFTIERAPTPPGTVSVSSSTHPDQENEYEERTVTLNWEKGSGVEGFSYVFDESDSTTPPTTITSAETAVTYTDAPISTNYFHIRAKNADGWGPTTHFRVRIKEPDPKIDESLQKPVILSAEKSDNYTTDIDQGTLTGITLKGTGLVDFAVNIELSPKDRLPEELQLTTTPDESGNWTIIWDKPIPAGFYTLTAQSQKDKTLSPLSNTAKLEVSVGSGGNVKLITESDRPSLLTADSQKVVNLFGREFQRSNMTVWIIAIIVLVLGSVATFFAYRSIQKKRRTKSAGETKNFPRL